MPHVKNIRRFFGWHWRTKVRPRILARARSNWTGALPAITQIPDAAPCERCRRWLRGRKLEVAHLHIAPGEPGHDADDNLSCLWVPCHKRHDYVGWAKACYETRCRAKDAARPILQLTQETL
jgi:hypothetical protein